MLGLHCYADFSLAAESGGHPLVAECRLLSVVAPLVTQLPGSRAQTSSWAHRLSCHMTCGIFLGPETEPESPASAGRFFTSEP